MDCQTEHKQGGRLFLSALIGAIALTVSATKAVEAQSADDAHAAILGVWVPDRSPDQLLKAKCMFGQMLLRERRNTGGSRLSLTGSIKNC